MPHASRSLNVLVVGAGLGGLAAGLALQVDGHNVTIIDAAPEFAEVRRPSTSKSHEKWSLSLGITMVTDTGDSRRLGRGSGSPQTQAGCSCDGALTWSG